MKIELIDFGRGAARYALVATSFTNAKRGEGPEKWSADRGIVLEELTDHMKAMMQGYLQMAIEEGSDGELKGDRLIQLLTSAACTAFATGFETALDQIERGNVFAVHEWELPEQFVDMLREQSVGRAFEAASYTASGRGIKLVRVRPGEPEWPTEDSWTVNALVNADDEVVELRVPRRSL